jgi:hypothetical protein
MKPAAFVCLGLLIGLLAGRELHEFELRYLVASAKPTFRVQAREIRERDTFGRPTLVVCPECVGAGRIGWPGSTCESCQGQKSVSCRYSKWRFVEVGEEDRSDYQYN